MATKRKMSSVYNDIKRDSRLYHYHSWYNKKSLAVNEAKRLRKAGYRAIVKTWVRSGIVSFAVYNTSR